MAVRVDQTGQQQLGAVADHASAGVFRRDRCEGPGLDDRPVGDRDGPGRDHPRFPQTRIGDRIGAAHDDGLGHALAPVS